MPPEDGVDRCIDKDNEETPLPILTYGSHDVTVTEYNIDTLCREGSVAENDNYPDPENGLHSEDILPSPEIINFGFQVAGPWHQSGNFPVGKEKIKTVSNIRVQHMSHLDLLCKL